MKVVPLVPAFLSFASALARPYVSDDDLLPRDEDIYLEARDLDWGLEDRDVVSELDVRDFDDGYSGLGSLERRSSLFKRQSGAGLIPPRSSSQHEIYMNVSNSWL